MKTRSESALRRAVARTGHRLIKSRTRNDRASDWQTYHIADAQNNLAASGLMSGFGLTTDDVERWLAE